MSQLILFIDEAEGIPFHANGLDMVVQPDWLSGARVVAPVTHPILPAGYNADDNNGDEVDGAGTNWPIWPVYFDTFEGLLPLIVTDEMIETFVLECADIAFSWEDNSVELPFEQLTLMIPSEVTTVLIAGESDALVISRQVQTQAIPGDKRTLAIVGKSDTLALPDETDTAAIRKAG